MKKTVFLQALDLFLEFNDDLIFILMHLIVLIDSKKFFFTALPTLPVVQLLNIIHHVHKSWFIN